MSPGEALHNPIFLRYAGLTLAILALAGAALFVVRFVLGKNIASIWLTYRSWLVMVVLIATCVFAGRAGVIPGVTLLSIGGFAEFARATGLDRNRAMSGVAYTAIMAVATASLITDPARHVPGWLGLFMAMPVYAIALIILVPILRNRTQGQLRDISLAVFGFLYVGWMFGHLGFLANSRNPYGYVLYLLLATELNDVAAFTFGKLFGSRPLRSAISPRKTWGGALGALGFSMLLPWVLRFSFPGFHARELILTGLIVGVGGQLGDLSISVIKRDLGVKDMGTLIPGHGGILDRIDSLIFVAPLFLYMLKALNQF